VPGHPPRVALARWREGARRNRRDHPWRGRDGRRVQVQVQASAVGALFAGVGAQRVAVELTGELAGAVTLLSAVADSLAEIGRIAVHGDAGGSGHDGAKMTRARHRVAVAWAGAIGREQAFGEGALIGSESFVTQARSILADSLYKKILWRS
jgi:hypothetical protein